jgi:type IV secretory pathway TrbD component
MQAPWAIPAEGLAERVKLALRQREEAVLNHQRAFALIVGLLAAILVVFVVTAALLGFGLYVADQAPQIYAWMKVNIPDFDGVLRAIENALLQERSLYLAGLGLLFSASVWGWLLLVFQRRLVSA